MTGRSEFSISFSIPGDHRELDLNEIDSHPLLAETLEVWRSLGRDGRLPTSLDPVDLPREVIKGVNLFERDPESGEWVVRLAGALLTDRHGREIRGSGYEQGFNPADLDKVKKAIDAMVQRGEPRLMRRDFIDPRGVDWHYVQLVLPMSSDGIARDRYATVIDPDTFGLPGEPL